MPPSADAAEASTATNSSKLDTLDTFPDHPERIQRDTTTANSNLDRSQSNGLAPIKPHQQGRTRQQQISPTGSAPGRRNSNEPEPDHERSSDAETEPLPYDEDTNHDTGLDGDHDDHDGASSDVMDPATLDQHASALGHSDNQLNQNGGPAVVHGSEHDGHVGVAMSPMQEADQRRGDVEEADGHVDVEVDADADAEADADGDEAMLPASQTGSATATSTQGGPSNFGSPQKTGAYTGDELSAESDLTDEPEDDEDDEEDQEDASSLSDDLGSDEEPGPSHDNTLQPNQSGDDDVDADGDGDDDDDGEGEDDEDGFLGEARSERRSGHVGRHGSSTRRSARKERGPLSDEDDEDEEDEDEEDDDDDDRSDAGRDRTGRQGASGEDEAAEALAALTGGGSASGLSGGSAAEKAANQAAATVEGLEGLAALASAGMEHRHDTLDEDDGVDSKKEPRIDQLRAPVQGTDTPSSDITPEPEDEEGEMSEADQDSAERMKELAMIASMKKRAAATGGAVSLLEPDPVDSLPGSAATSRAGSEIDEDEEENEKEAKAKELEAGEKPEHGEGGGGGEAEVEAGTAAGDEQATGADTPAAEVAEQEEDTSTDEAAIRRQEAMEALTKIEIGFAMLRDRLYVERLEEISKEGEMIADGSHPELQHLTNAIDIRRQRRMKLVEMWFEQQEAQYERVAKAEEAAAWSVWKTSSASLRRDMMDDYSRKRRRLDREKRSLDAPRPVRRHQVFETELVRNPDRLHAPMVDPASNEQDERTGPARKRKAAAMRRAMAEESEAANEFVAYPDLRGLGEADVWMDIERMGIRPAEAQAAMYDSFYMAGAAGELPNPELYAMYGPEAAAAAAAAQMGMASGFGPPGYAGGMRMPVPVAPGTPGSQHAPVRHGHHSAAAGHPMAAYDAYVAELEHAHMQQQQQQHLLQRLPPHHEMVDPHGRAVPSRYPPEMYGGYPPPHIAQAQLQQQQQQQLQAQHQHQHHQQQQQQQRQYGAGMVSVSPTPRHRSSRKEQGDVAPEKAVGSSSGRGGRGGSTRGGGSGRGRSSSSKHSAAATGHSSSGAPLPPAPAPAPAATSAAYHDERDTKSTSYGANGSATADRVGSSKANATAAPAHSNGLAPSGSVTAFRQGLAPPSSESIGGSSGSKAGTAAVKQPVAGGTPLSGMQAGSAKARSTVSAAITEGANSAPPGHAASR